MLFLLVQIKLLVLISLKSDMYAVFQAFSLLLNLENMPKTTFTAKLEPNAPDAASGHHGRKVSSCGTAKLGSGCNNSPSQYSMR